MALLKQELATRGVVGGIPAPADAPIEELDAEDLLHLQAAFGALVMENPRLTQLVNRFGPVVFATGLFTCMEAYEVDSADPDDVVPTRDVFEAESAAIGLVRSVAAAFGKLYGTVSVDPTEAEIDADTTIEPV